MSRVQSLVDTAPLRGFLERGAPGCDLDHQRVEEGRDDCAGVAVATVETDGETARLEVVFGVLFALGLAL